MSDSLPPRPAAASPTPPPASGARPALKDPPMVRVTIATSGWTVTVEAAEPLDAVAAKVLDLLAAAGEGARHNPSPLGHRAEDL